MWINALLAKLSRKRKSRHVMAAKAPSLTRLVFEVLGEIKVPSTEFDKHE